MARSTTVVDPLEALERLARMAQDAQLAIAEGRALNGRGALRKIELEAKDARRWASVRRGTIRA